MKRLQYKKDIDNLISLKNQTWFNLKLSANIKKYPDMYLAYKSFSDIFNLSFNRFILSNGCEMAIKNALLALKPKTIFYNTPCWALLDVLSQSCNILKITEQSYYKNKLFYSENSKQAEIYYTTLGRNNLFVAKDQLTTENQKFKLIDVSYFNIYQIKQIIINYPNDIICGSFDKIYGPGLRLGFAIYPQKYNQKFQLQREQYINALAASFLINNNIQNISIELPEYIKIFQKLPNYICNTNNYITFEGKLETKIKGKIFNIKDNYFTRYGIPETKAIAKKLLKEIKQNIL